MGSLRRDLCIPEVTSQDIARLAGPSTRQHLILDVVKFESGEEIARCFEDLCQKHSVAQKSCPVTKVTSPMLIVCEHNTTRYHWHVVHHCTADRGTCRCWYGKWLRKNQLNRNVGRIIRRRSEYDYYNWHSTVEYYSCNERRLLYVIDKRIVSTEVYGPEGVRHSCSAMEGEPNRNYRLPVQPDDGYFTRGTEIHNRKRRYKASQQVDEFEEFLMQYCCEPLDDSKYWIQNPLYRGIQCS